MHGRMRDLDPATFRRLLLAKELYLHAVEHSHQPGAINKMIAVHNFHNSAEVTLRGITLFHEIRAERELNIDFEALLNTIDQAPKFKNDGQRLPYRQELRKLNSVRNLVQHHAHEPEESTMEEWRVFIRRFLERAYEEYFGSTFNEISGLTLVSDPQLRRLASLAERALSSRAWIEAASTAKVALTMATWSLLGTHSLARDQSRAVARMTMHRALEKSGLGQALAPIVDGIVAKIEGVRDFAAIVGSGVPLAALERYERFGIGVSLPITGEIETLGGKGVTEEDARWIHRFAIETILKWQTSQLDPHVPEQLKNGCERYLQSQESPASEAPP